MKKNITWPMLFHKVLLVLLIAVRKLVKAFLHLIMVFISIVLLLGAFPIIVFLALSETIWEYTLKYVKKIKTRWRIKHV